VVSGTRKSPMAEGKLDPKSRRMAWMLGIVEKRFRGTCPQYGRTLVPFLRCSGAMVSKTEIIWQTRAGERLAIVMGHLRAAVVASLILVHRVEAWGAERAQVDRGQHLQ